MSEFISNLFARKKLRWVKNTVFWKMARTLYYLPAYLCSLQCFFRKKVHDRKTIFVMIHALSGGGAERVATILASELSARYHVVLLYSRNRKQTYPVAPKVDRMLIPGRLWNPEKNSRFLTHYIRALKKSQRAYASISLLYAMNMLNVASRAGDKVICSERNNPSKSSDACRLDEIQSIYEKADHVIFQSALVRDLFNDTVRSHCSILPNPVSTECLRKKDRRHRIVNCGRLQEQKNQVLLIRAFYRFHDIHPEYTLSIYGEGPLRGELTECIQSMQLQAAVRLEGRSAKVHQEISDAEFFVLSSDYEGMSNALLEAMMMGFPCISTDCEGSVDVIENGVNGLLTSRGSEEELLSAMLLYAEDEEYREKLGMRALQTAERFKRERVAEEWAELIERIQG